MMSHEVNDRIIDDIRDTVHELWQLDSRPDLEADCCEYVYERYEYLPIYKLVIEFLSKHCSDAMSTQDYEHMHHEALLNANSEEAYKILKQRQENKL